jgi:YQGE family putative transporter
VFLFTLGGFRAVVEYNLVSALMVVVFYAISGWLLTRITLKKCLLLGLGAHILLFSLLFLFREQSLILLIPLGIVNGTAIAVFWAAMAPLQYVLTTDETRYKFFGHQSFLFSITGGIAPLFGGVLISLSGFLISKVFGYSFVFFLIALLMMLCYREAKNLPEYEKIVFSFADVIRHRRSWVWKLALLQDFFYGLFDFMFASFAAIIMFLIVKSEFLLL